MTALRNAAAVAGIGLGLTALAFGLFADPTSIQLTSPPDSVPLAAQGAGVASQSAARLADEIAQSEGGMGKVAVDPGADIAAPSVAGRPGAAPAGPAVPTPVSAPQAKSTIGWTRGPKPGEPMLDPTPRN